MVIIRAHLKFTEAFTNKEAANLNLIEQPINKVKIKNRNGQILFTFERPSLS